VSRIAPTSASSKRILRADASYASSIAALSIEAWLNTYIKDGISALFANYVLDEFGRARIVKLLNDPREVFLVFRDVGGIVGYIRISVDRSAPVDGCSGIEITSLYVQPHHQRKGLGKLLLEEAMAFCKVQKAESVWLTVNSENLSAIKFYEKTGFRNIGNTLFHIEDQSYRNEILIRNL
jgi:ribosomal protein S18 acetylase RimI-like enzyme